jgi:16S rRNA (guanine527-N7)-methyltransferase
MSQVAHHLFEQRLKAAALELNLPLPKTACERLLHFIRLLDQWNKTYNLTAVREPQEQLVQHLFDSLSIANCLDTHLSAKADLWDIGSGAGLPGLPLAILWPERHMTTIDSVGKKIAFQNHAIASLGLKNATAVHGRVEQQSTAHPADMIVCRAFSSLAQFALSCTPLVGPNTILAAMKGKLPETEIAELPPSWQILNIVPLKVPELEAERHLIMIRQL